MGERQEGGDMMNKKAWAIVLVCAALILSACGAASDAPDKSTVPASEGADASEEARRPPATSGI